MKEVRVDKIKLLRIVRSNRDDHRSIFIAAQAQYRKKAIEVLDDQLKAARKGRPFVLSTIIELVQPVDHTADYDRAIKMLELSVDDWVLLSAADFSNLVQDQWDWSHHWAVSNSRYVDSPKFRAAMER